MRAPARILVGRLALFIFVIGLDAAELCQQPPAGRKPIPDCGAFPTADPRPPWVRDRQDLSSALRSLSLAPFASRNGSRPRSLVRPRRSSSPNVWPSAGSIRRATVLNSIPPLAHHRPRQPPDVSGWFSAAALIPSCLVRARDHAHSGSEREVPMMCSRWNATAVTGLVMVLVQRRRPVWLTVRLQVHRRPRPRCRT
jgi:hypothetical protein